MPVFLKVDLPQRPVETTSNNRFVVHNSKLIMHKLLTKTALSINHTLLQPKISIYLSSFLNGIPNFSLRRTTSEPLQASI